MRHYHQAWLLEPADADPDTGYRRHTVDQLPAAQVIRRFRELGMPLEEIRAVLATSDLRARNDRIAAHLDHLEGELSRTQHTVSALRDPLAPERAADALEVELRRVPAVPAAVIIEAVDGQDSVAWLQATESWPRSICPALVPLAGSTPTRPSGKRRPAGLPYRSRRRGSLKEAGHADCEQATLLSDVYNI
ncbi:MerR family DNA-binding protein [Amycolatopsis halotolerans]|uniref:MerR family DNA-binding protein n=1 Tax=Amycolatopsis halotolerans TaxID=330083 RepID=A0ABV7QYQ9_9PSEU